MSDIVLEASKLTKSFKGFTAVDDVSLAIERGSIHALIGPNGAGKTTCFNLLTKFLSPTSGTIRFNGRDITRMKPDAISRLGLVRSFQVSAVFDDLTVFQNVRLAVQRRRGESYDFWRSRASLADYAPRVHELLASVGLEAVADIPAANLPYGQKRALELATTLALEPEVILLDEPTAGMGIEDVDRITQLIREAARGRTVLMVEHNLGVVADLCDRITVLARGQILAAGSYAAVSADPRVVDAYLGAGHD